MSPDFALFAVTTPGLETFTAQELQDLTPLPGAARHPSPLWERGEGPGVGGEAGGLEFRASLRDLYRANLHLRTASRVLVRLGEFYAAAFSELRKKAGRLPWENFIAPGQPVAIRATCHKSRLYHSDAVAERVAGAIEDRLGGGRDAIPPSAPPPPPAADTPYPSRRLGGAQAGAHRVSHTKGDEDAETPAAQLIVVRLVRDKCTISVDSSGALLHQRGYRLAAARAPLRETLAAAMVLASGWDARAPLLDPFCGAGT
ncbi:MAG: THUMP domain-containing class I SAM-dependent RNA methyltransferase, partial [Anaerolineales bacterium]